MKRQRNTAQLKKKNGRNSQDQINKDEINNLPEKEFRIIIVKMLLKIEWRKHKKYVTVITITEDIEEIKNKQTEMNNTITEIKSILEGTSSRIIEAEEWTMSWKIECWK